MTRYNIYWIVTNENTDEKTEKLIESNKEFRNIDSIVEYIQNNNGAIEDFEGCYDILNERSEILFPIVSALGCIFTIRVIDSLVDLNQEVA